MHDKLYEFLEKLPRAHLINLLWHALDEMQAYNGRSRTWCIMEALGGEEVEEGKWKFPTLKKAKENTESMGL